MLESAGGLDDPLLVQPPSSLARLAGAALLTALALAHAAPASALADEELRQLQQQVRVLQDRIDAQQRRLDRQEARLRASGDDPRGGASRLSAFLKRTDFSGWVAASYFWNFDRPRKPSAGGDGPFSNPFHADPNSFQFDEAWFVLDRRASEESPAGFHVELVFGATASAFSQLENERGGTGNLNGNDLWVPSANVSYRTPWGPTITAGKFATPLGYEMPGAARNVNVTRGFTWNLFEPVSQTGALVSQRLDSGFRWTLGVVNGFRPQQPNENQSLGALAQVGYANDSLALLLGGFYTDDTAGDGRDSWLLDGVAELRPTDALLLWLDAAWEGRSLDGGHPLGVGVSVGTRVAVSNGLGVGARAEYAHFDADGVQSFVDGASRMRLLDGDLWSLTGTLDYAFTDELTGKLEAKYEKGENGLGGSYKDGRKGVASDQILLGSQLYYTF